MEKVNINTLLEETKPLLHGNNISVLRDFREIHEHSEEFMPEGFVIALITNGSAETKVDNEVYHFQVNDIFYCQPNRLFQNTMVTVDFDAIVFYINPDYAEQLLKKMRIDWSIIRMSFVLTHEVYHLTEEETNILKLYEKLILEKLNMPENPSKQRSIDLIFCSMIYDLLEYYSINNDVSSSEISASKDVYMNKFFKLLRNDDVPFTNVIGYAAKLNISPKYFSSLCKQATGQTASQLIDQEIINSAQVLLCDNRYSIKQISNKLGFANQSHFGKFFRAHVGVSPQKYRTNNNV